jgi:hypothetical protein
MRQAERAGQDRRRMQRVFDGDLDGLAESTLPMFVTQQSGRPVPAAEDLMWARRGGFVPDVLLVPSDGEEDAKAAATWQLPGTADQGVVNMAAAELNGRGRLVVSRGTILPSGPLTLSGKHLHGMGASEATVIDFLSWTGSQSADLLSADEVSGLRLKLESSVAVGKSLWPHPFTSPAGDFRWAVSVNRMTDCRIAGTVYLGASGHGYASHVRCSGLNVGGGETRAVGVTVDGPEGLYVGSGDVQLVGVSVTAGPTNISGGRCSWSGREARKVTVGGEVDLDLARSGELVIDGGSGYLSVRTVAGDVTVNGGLNTLADMRLTGSGRTLTLNASSGTRLLHVDLGSGTFVDNGYPYFACGCQGIPNTCSCGGGSSAHDLSDADPLPDGTADPGTSGDASRSDHVHPTVPAEVEGAWDVTEVGPSATSVTVAHGQADAGLGDFQVGKNGPLGAATDWWWTADDTDLTVHVDQAPGVTVPFVWRFLKTVPAVPFSPLDVPWHTVFWADQIAGLADGDPVAQWDDLSGNGRHASQPTASQRPLYRPAYAPLGGRPAVVGDATDDFLRTAPFSTALPQPTTIVVVGVLPAAGNSTFVDGVASGAARQAVYNGWSPGYVSMWAGAGTNVNSTTAINATPSRRLYVATFAGASSELWVDGTVRGSGNPGGNGLGGVTLLSFFDGSNAMGAAVSFVGVLPRALTFQERDGLLAWSQNHYGTP